MEQGPGIAERIQGLVEAQLGRPPRGLRSVAVWCPFGFPAVIETSPYLPDGMPFPTLLYLTCPSAVAAVSQEEGGEGVRRLRERLGREAAAAEALELLEGLYRDRRRDVAGEGPFVDEGASLSSGIGGVASLDRLSCLHALAAALLAAVTGWPGLLAQARPTVGTLDAWESVLSGVGGLWCKDTACRSFVARGAGSAASPKPRDLPGRLAAVDVGTMSCRVLVADVIDGRPQALLRKVTITRLGESLDALGRLLPAARARTAIEVREAIGQARALGADSITIMGTSAVRDAVDGPAFLHELGHALGVASLVAPGELEARLTYAGATLDVPGDPVLLDIGGGSTELVRRGPDGRLTTVSLQLGSIRSTERWIRHDPPLPAELAAVREEAEALLRPIVERLVATAGSPRGAAVTTGPARRARRPPLVGVAGTVTTLACLNLALEEYDPDAVHLSVLSARELDEHIVRLARLSARERLLVACMQPGREEVILAGAEILRAVMTVLGYRQVVVSERDLLDGMILHSEELQTLAQRP